VARQEELHVRSLGENNAQQRVLHVKKTSQKQEMALVVQCYQVAHRQADQVQQLQSVNKKKLQKVKGLAAQKAATMGTAVLLF
jgi:predicted aconitase